VVFDVAVPGRRFSIRARDRARRSDPETDGRVADAQRILAMPQKRLTAAITSCASRPTFCVARRGSCASARVDLEVRICLHALGLWAFPQAAAAQCCTAIHCLTRSALVGEPRGVYCRGVRHPESPELADTRNTIVLDYGDTLRCSVTTNHAHRFGAKHACSEMKLEGVRGAARLVMGVNLDYPRGKPDALELCAAGGEWRDVPLVGSWFVDAFMGPMSNLQRFVAGEDERLETRVEDAIRAMALVEACYRSSASGGTAIP
jgi:hypothetical protein